MSNKVLIIMIGISGSGKSTLAKKIADEYMKAGHSVSVNSTDNFFLNKTTGEYEFNPAKLGHYHKMNQTMAMQDMENDVEVVIIDNTNLTPKERKPYIDMAKQYGYNVRAIEPTTAWKHNKEELVQRNKHNVPIEAIERMLDRYVPFNKLELE